MNYYILLGVIGGLILLAVLGVVIYFITRKKPCVCPAGEKCYEDKCIPETTCAPSCKQTETCINGKCEPTKDLLPCSVDAECKEGFHCTKGYCVNSCINDSSCPGSQACIDKTCKLKACSVNTQCLANEACISGKCIGNISCISSCPNDLICDRKLCKQCVTDKDCKEGSCTDGRCTLCVYPENVPSVECPQIGTCIPSGDCCPKEGLKKRCTEDKECLPTNPFCLKTNGTGLCLCSKFPDGTFCTEDSNCISGKCNNVCYSGECYNSSQCPAGEYCKNSICSKDIIGSRCEIKPTDPCIREGNYCVNNVCSKTPGGYGSVCVTDKDCATGYICKPSIKEKFFPICVPK